jgi:class 3 adenylate cyclase/tetratricopeptide (TPR) repeat protein
VDIAAWLRELGLERYEEAFQENEIHADILPTLTAEDLKDLGVNVVGHRRLLLNAIADLRAHAGGPGTDAASEPREEIRGHAERRQLTVLLCDLVGSTALSGRLDPEDMRQVIRLYQEAVASEVTRFDGHIAKYMGDGVLTFFGWPEAHEDDAERAVHAGLAVSQAIARLHAPDGSSLAVRVGIATGLVVVGDLIGEGGSQEEAVVGESPNLAARLQALAAPGTVIIAAGTRRLVGELFELADLGAHDFKGFAEPVRAWQVVGPCPAESRFEALHGKRLIPLVGREHEVGVLLGRWARAKVGEGQVVLVSGEPGIGKSRVARAIRERLGHEAYTYLRYQCSRFHTHSALYPFIERLERAADFSRHDAAEIRLDKLEELLARATDTVANAAPLIAALLSIPTKDRYPPINFSPQRQKEKTIDVLVEQLTGLAARRTVLLVFEDVHWIDPTSLEALDRTIERIQDLPVLALITYRPEFRPPWLGLAHVTALVLNRLGRLQSAAMAALVARTKGLPSELLDQITARTDGVPLFVEELTRTVLESGLLEDRGDHYALSGPLPPRAIPATLQDSLMARLDRLAPAKEVAQTAAVIGREFPYDLLAAAADRPQAELDAALDQLVTSELLFQRGVPPEATYMFKHALVQDAAYASLLRGRRQQLHTRIAQALEQQFGEIAEHEPEVVAQHYTGAGLAEHAIGYWQRAGERANDRSANDEAASHLRTALDLITRLPAGPDRQQREIAALTVLGRVLTAKSGYGNPEVEQVYSRARRLCEAVPEDANIFPVLLGSAIYSAVRAELVAGLELSERLLELARQKNDPLWMVEAHYARGIMHSWRGDFKEAREHLELAARDYRPERHRAHLALYGQDPGPICLCRGAAVLWHVGYPDQALARMEDALGLVEELAHPFSRAYVLTWTAALRILRREVAEAAVWIDRALMFATEQAYPFWTAWATAQRGWLSAQQGQSDQAIAQLEDGLSQMRAVGTEVTQASVMGWMGEALASLGRTSDALRLIEQALDKVDRNRERWGEAELLRLRGVVLLAADTRAAESSCRQAIERSRQQDAKSWELRAAISLAHLWRDQGRRAEACDLLAPIYGWFTEGFDTADLQDAKALLDELR